MSAPHVTGLIALMWQAAPCLIGDYATTETIIENTAIPVPYDDGNGGGAHVPNYAAGWGEINALAAVQAAISECGDSAIVGQITDAITSAPVAEATVQAASTTTQRRTTSNADGLFAFTLFSDTYTLTASRYGYQTAVTPDVMATAGTTTTQNIVLTPAAFYEVSGQVTDAATGWPLYAQISITGDPVEPTAPDNEVWTDPETGMYSVMLAEGVTYTFGVEAWAAGYSPATGEVGPLTTDAHNTDFALQADTLVCNAPGYVLQTTEVFFDSFEGATSGTFPADGWSQVDVSGTSGNWTAPTAGTFPAAAPYSGNRLASFNSFNASAGASTRLWRAPTGLDLTGTVSPRAEFWFFHGDCGWNSGDNVQLQVSTNGGVAWDNVGVPVVQKASGDWERYQFDLSAYADSTDLRVGLLGISQYGCNMHIDDVRVFDGVCEIPVDGGLVVGNAYDANYPTMALNGAEIVNAAGDATESVPTPLDDAVDDGFYTLFAPSGAQVFTATMTGGYGPDVATVTVVDGDTVVQDFQLPAGMIAATPAGVAVTVPLGYTENATLNLENDGSFDAAFELKEHGGHYVPINIQAYTGNLPADDAPVSTGLAPRAIASVDTSAPLALPLADAAPAFAIDLNTGELGTFMSDTPGTWSMIGNTGIGGPFAGDFLNGDFSQMYVIDYDTNNFYVVDTATGAATVIGTSTPASGQVWTGLTGSTDGTLYAASTDGAQSYLHTVDPATGATTVIGEITNAPITIDIAINADGQMYGVDIGSDVLVAIDLATGAGTVIGSLGYSANYAQGLDFEEESGILYWAAYGASGELRIIDTTTGASASVGAFPGGTEVDCLAFATGGASDVPWLMETPTMGSVPTAGSTPIALDFDAAYVDQPGEYHAELIVTNDTPYGKFNIPVTMTVTAPNSWGKIEGTVTGLGVCDGDPTLLEGAEVYIESATTGAMWTLATDAAGTYALWLDEGHSPVTVTVMAPDYHEVVGDVVIEQGETTTLDFVMRALLPCLSYDPAGLEATLEMGDNEMQLLDLHNTGAALATFELRELGGEFWPAAPAPLPLTTVTIGDPIGDNAFTVNPAPASSAASQAWALPAAPDGVYILTHSLSQDIIDANSVSCSSGGLHADNSYLRTFYLPDFGIMNPFEITAVEMGIETAAGASGDQPVEVRLYTLDGALLWANLTLIGQASVNIPDQTLSHFTIPVSGNAPAGSTLVVEFFTPNGQTAGHTLFVGSNNLGQTALSYLAAADCGITEPTDTGTIGFPEMQIVMNVTGMTAGAGGVPWLFEDPISGTIPADSMLPVDITFDAGVPETMQPGEYHAELQVMSDAPNAVPGIPVTLTVLAPATWGKVAGTVTGLGYCDVATPTLLADAEITVESGTGLVAWMLTTDENGDYQLWMDAAHSPVTVTVAHPDHITQVFPNVAVTAGGTTVQDAALRWAQPCLTVEPDLFDVTVTLGMSTTVPFSLTNLGATGASFGLVEANGGFMIMAPFAVHTTLPTIVGASNPAWAESGASAGEPVIGVPAGGAAPAAIGPAWETMASMPSARVFNAVIADTNGYVYVIGGTSDAGGGTPTDTTFRYNTATDSWDTMATMPTALDAIDGVAINGKIYIPGGAPTANTFVYDIATNTWSTLATTGGYTARSQYQVVAIGTDLYVLGGIVASAAASTTEVWVLDTTTGAWTAGVPMQKSRISFSAGAIDDEIYVAGGVLFPDFIPDMTAEKFDGTSWSYIASVPDGGGTYTRWSYNADGVGTDGLWLGAGRRDLGWTFLDHAGYYDPDTDTWTDSPTIPTLAQGRVYMEGDVASDGYFYVIGGRDSAGASVYATNERLEVGYAGGGAAGTDIPWLFEDPESGAVAADSTFNVDLTFDASDAVTEVTQPGEYFGTLFVTSDDPVNASIPVPVTMTVLPPATWGKLMGTVTGLGYCDADPAPVEEADVLIEASDGTTWTLVTDDMGVYAVWLDEGHSPVTITVSVPDHEKGEAFGVSVTGGMTTTQDFDLRWLEPCVNVAPDAIIEAVALGASTTVPMTITNAGAADSAWSLYTASMPAWLSATPTSGNVLADGGEAAIAVTLDSGVLAQPGEYTYMLTSFSDDPVEPVVDTPVTFTVATPAGWAVLDGTVYSTGYCDAEMNPLASADVTIENGVSTLLTTAANGEYSYWLAPGTYTVTVTAADHTSAAEVVTLTTAVSQTQDFILTWLGPCSTGIEPDSMEVTVAMGMSTTLPLTMTNAGAGALGFSFGEEDGGFQPMAPNAGENVLVVAYDTTAATAMEAALTNLGYTYLDVDRTTFQTMALADVLAYKAVFYAGSTSGDSWAQATAYLDAGGSLYISDNDLGFSNSSTTFYQTYLQATFVSDLGSDGVLTGMDVMAGLNPDISPDPWPDDFIVGAEGVEIFAAPSGNSSGVKVDRNGYKAIYTSFDFDDVASAADEQAIVERVMGFLLPDGVPWLAEDPAMGTVPSAGNFAADIIFDAGVPEVTQPGDYMANLIVETDDPVVGNVTVPVTMHVTLPATYGQITGTVMGLGPCDDPLTAAALEEAEVTVESALQSWTLSTGADGIYILWLDETHSPVTITVMADGYLSQVVGSVAVVSGTTTTQDFALRSEAPCFAGVMPADAHVTLAMGMSTTMPISVVNTGAAALAWSVKEADVGFQIMAPSAGEDVLVVAYDTTAATAMETALTNLGYTYLRVDRATFEAMALVDLLEYKAIFYAGGYSNDSWAKAMAYLDAGGSLYISDNDLGYGNSSTVFYQTYLQATYVSDSGSDGVLTGMDIMAGVNPDVSPDPYPDDFIVGAEGVEIFQSPSTNSAGVKVERNDYKAIYTSFDFDDVASAADEQAIIERVMGFLATAGVPWLDEDPTAGTAAPEATAPVTLTFDAGVPEVTQPGDYYATLTFGGSGVEVEMPVTMTVEAPATWGKLAGLVQGLGYCDVMTTPLEGAVVFVESTVTTDTWALETDAAGLYGLWLDEMYSPLTVTIAYEAGYDAQVFANVAIVSGTVTTLDADLFWLQPCITVAPDVLAFSVPLGTTATVGLNLTNMGAFTGTFDLDEWSLGFEILGPLATGGPDSFGYQFADSNTAGISPDYDFVDISDAGAPVALGDNDFAEVAIGFDFKFYGVSEIDPNLYDTVFVNSNGFLSFGTGSTDISPDPVLPDPTLPNNLIAAAWDDLKPGVGGMVYVQSFGQCPYNPYPDTVDACFIVQYDNFVHADDSPAGTWEVILFRSGSILMQYAEVDAPAATTGIEGPLGLAGLNYDPTLADELAICFAYPDERLDCQSTQVSWLDVDVDEGKIAAYDDTTIVVTLDATVPEVNEPGDYLAELLVSSDDPFNPLYVIPVTMTVDMPTTMGKMWGTVYAWGYCDAVSMTMSGAQVMIANGAGDVWMTHTDADGNYGMWLPADDIVTMTVMADGYVAATMADMVDSGVMPAHDVELHADMPCVQYETADYNVIVVQGESTTRMLTLRNAGAGELSYSNYFATAMWLSVAPETGVVAPYSSQDVELVFDSTGLAVGVYNSNMEIIHNDSETERLFVRPIQMTVVAEGTILLPMLDAKEGYAGETVTYAMTVTNFADTAVTFDVLASGNVWTTTVPMTVTVAANGMTTFNVDVAIPLDAQVGITDTVTITAESQGADGQLGVALLQTTVVEQPTYYIYLPLVLRNAQ